MEFWIQIRKVNLSGPLLCLGMVSALGTDRTRVHNFQLSILPHQIQSLIHWAWGKLGQTLFITLIMITSQWTIALDQLHHLRASKNHH